MRERDYHMNVLLPCRIPTHPVSKGAPTARASTRFHFESQGHTDRGDDREYDLLPPDETTDPQHPLGKA